MSSGKLTKDFWIVDEMQWKGNQQVNLILILTETHNIFNNHKNFNHKNVGAFP